MDLFVPTDVPRHHHANSDGKVWLTWSPFALGCIKANAAQLQALSLPTCIDIRSCEPYASTYTYRWSGLPDKTKSFALDAANALLRTPVDSRLKLLTGLLDPPLTSSLLHKCFALIRAGIVKLKRDTRTALYAPVATKKSDGGFPLHSDLFLTNRLWLVFDRVPRNNAGRALFLSRRLLEIAINNVSLMPQDSKQELKKLLRGNGRTDGFDRCYDLLYSNTNPWAKTLDRAMKRDMWSIKLRRGEGYLLDDRLWLHGRTAVTKGIYDRRFCRLTYGNIADRAVRIKGE
jgi:hypothetical protein